MKAFLAVSKGSAIPPHFIVMKWNGDKTSENKIALVGKGLTYDSGGYSIKSGDSIVDMYNNMAGTAFISAERGYLPKGATGVPVKTLCNLVKEDKGQGYNHQKTINELT